MVNLYDISMEEIEQIRELWEKNRIYHERNAEHFSEDYKNANFDRRMNGFKSYPTENLKITVAEESGERIGYCLSAVKNGVGELETLHVDERFRGTGTGKALVKEHIAWMKEKDCETIGVTVMPENESTVGFYRSLGFFPNTMYMRMK